MVGAAYDSEGEQRKLFGDFVKTKGQQPIKGEGRYASAS
jgi:hypothetical protein